MRVKGSALIHSRTFLEGRLGTDELARVQVAMSPADRQILASQVRAHGWYPVSIWNAISEAVVREGGVGTLRQLAAYVADNDLTVAYRLLLSVGSPHILFRRAGLFWAKYFDGGRFESVRQGDKRFGNLLHAGTDPVLDPGVLTCREVVPAWQAHALRLTGVTGGKSIHRACRFDGLPACEYEVTWD
jgi:hypothetical protein